MTRSPDEKDGHREAVAQELLDWIHAARTLVDAHFPRESTAAHSAMVLETARTLMLADRLAAVGGAVAELNRTLVSKAGS